MNSVNAQYVQHLQTSAFLNLATSSLQVKQKANKGEQQNRSGSLVTLPNYACEPYLARTGNTVVSPTRRVQRPRATPQVNKQHEVCRSLFSKPKPYIDEDVPILASPFEVSNWEEAYHIAVEKAVCHAQLPVGGRLRRYADAWQDINASRKVVRWLRDGYKLPFVEGGEDEAKTMLRKVCPRNLCIHYTDKLRNEALHDLVGKLLDKDVIEEVPDGELAFHNLLFLRIKPNGTWRGITDTSTLNTFLRVKKFRMDTVQTIREALTTELYATSVDFSDAYYHIPVHPSHRRYLAFQVGSVRYWFKATPFGLSPLPQVFTEIFETLKCRARQTMNIMVFQPPEQSQAGLLLDQACRRVCEIHHVE